MHEKKKATVKAKDLIRMAIAKASLIQPLYKEPLKVNPQGLVLGGGISGMTAALALANSGFYVHLVEKEKMLGGNINRLQYLLEGEDPKQRLEDIISEVKDNKNIGLHLNSEVLNIDGYVGDYKTTVSNEGKEEVLEHPKLTFRGTPATSHADKKR